MDAVRFGKALGIGVKAAGTALKSAAEAAAAPDPRPLRRPGAAPQTAADPSQNQPVPREQVHNQAGRRVARGVIQSRTAAAGVAQGSRRFGRAVWGPAARAGGVLWYEVTGAFFALFALAAAVEAWHRRAGLFATSGQREKAWFAIAMLVAFGWFTVSSFVKAQRRARKP